MPPLVVDNSSYFGTGYRWWGGAETLLWAISPGHAPPLATTGTTSSLGAIGPGTTILNDGNQDYNLRVGGRFTTGYWLDPGRMRGIEGSFFFLNGPSDNFNASSSGAPGLPVLARPFVNAITGLQDSQQISFPGIASGSMSTSSGSQFLGAQLIGIGNLFSSGCCNTCCPPDTCCPTECCPVSYGGPQAGSYTQSGYRLDATGGFNYLNLNESLVIPENITVLPSAPQPFVPGSRIMATDRFQTRNNFYGGQIGVRAERWQGGWFVNASSQVAFGDTHQEVLINGSTVFANPGAAPIHQPGGLLALPTNMGSYSRDRFSVVPQVGFNVGRQLTNNIRIYMGYTLIYWTNVVRPGDQIDPVINPTQLPTPSGPGTLVGPARPAFAFHETDFWAHGVNFGLEFRR